MDVEFVVNVMQNFYSFNKLKEKKKNSVAQLEFMTIGDTNFWRWLLNHELYLLRKHEDEARRIQKVVMTNYEPVLYKIVIGKGVEFDASRVEDVDRVYMPLNLDQHWVAVEINIKDGTISVYDSLKMASHTRQASAKLALIARVSQRSLLQDNGGDCDVFTLKDIELLSAGLPLDVITLFNIPTFQLRMAIDMLHGFHNIVQEDANWSLLEGKRNE
ncbi:hypothetical protein D8674_003883 [Pyrus ussuriensis x Pyrus communis]|uniref:Ubiquitin-like protease family profile domain-containing protein n=1 Tax=Pyrus ussuriensis x Pyrus communis TaxID=2448454 RepID=A0A5N5FIA1_9ROSA|nr:hypothetical protein D8674_003883 [Pyrus ussuriensis x Pyrus communis]